MTIYFVCPDYELPSGGTRAIYQQVKYLIDANFDAVVAHLKPGFKLTWHGIDVPVTHLEGRQQFSPEDIWIVPESAGEVLSSFRNVPGSKLINALNWCTIFANLPQGNTWRDFGFSGAITPSLYVKQFIEWSLGVPCIYLPAAINPKLFYFNDQVPKQASLVAHMARKNQSGLQIERMAAIREGALRKLSWCAMTDLSEIAYADTLRNSTFYLATGVVEGLNMSVLEAMACGCIVIGYTGGGGREFMQGSGPDQNCILVTEGDFFALAIALEQAATALECDPNCFHSLIRNGLATAALYNDPNKERDHLVGFFERLSQH